MIFRMFNFMNSRMDEFIEEKKDIKLILDESLLLQDLLMPQQQYKLLNYVKDHPEHLDTLIEYITDFVDEANYHRQSYKYPFLASEILSKENDFFQDFLFEEQNLHYLNRLFSLLNEDILNVTQAGYFSKVVLTLLKKKHFKMLQYLNDRDISNLLKHLDVPHVAEIIEKVITPDPNDENQLLDKQKSILQRIMKISLNRYYEIEVFDNCMLIINNLLKSSINPEQEELVKILMNPYFFLTICYQSQRTSAYELVSNLLQYINNSGKTDYFLYFMDVAKHLPNAFTTTNIQAFPHQTTYGQIITPLSSNKLTLLQIYHLLLLSEKEEILNELINNQSFQVITNLILSHEFNNQALIWFDKIVVFIFQKLPEMFKSIQQFLALTILKYNKNEKKQVGSLQNHIKPGYQGILTKISNLLVDSHFTNEEWEQYVNDTLNKINSVEKRLLCDFDPKPRSIFQSIQDSTTIQPQKENDNKEEDIEVEEDIHEEDIGNLTNCCQVSIMKKNIKIYIQKYLHRQFRNFTYSNIENHKKYIEESIIIKKMRMKSIIWNWMTMKNWIMRQRIFKRRNFMIAMRRDDYNNCKKCSKFNKKNPKQNQCTFIYLVLRHKASSEELELIDEQIEEIISDPQTKPEQVAQIIQNEANLIEDIGPLELENKQDHQVNEYYKKHDDPKNEE